MLFGGKSWSWNDTAPETGAEESNARSYSDAGIEAFRSDNWDKMSDQEKRSLKRDLYRNVETEGSTISYEFLTI